MARAIELALHAVAGRVIVNAVDDHPVTYRELFCYLARAEGAAPPRDGSPQALESFRVRNALAKLVLGWQPHYASWRTGLA